jgi:predicted nucleic acid-binding Zn ribbon protein
MSKEQPLKDVIEKLIDAYKLRSKFDEKALQADWGEIAGKHIEKYTKELTIREKKLYIKVESSVVRQELTFIRSRLIEVINRRFGKKMIEEIVVL